MKRNAIANDTGRTTRLGRAEAWMRTVIGWGLGALALAGLAGLASVLSAGAVTAAEEEWVRRVYRVEHVKVHDAAHAAQQTCLDQPGKRECSFEMSGDWFTYFTDEATHERIAAALEALDVPLPTVSFRLTLIRADGTERPVPALPSGEQKALGDARQFLPFKGYRVVDTALMRTNREAFAQLGAEPVYVARLSFRPGGLPGADGILVERFQLATTVSVPEGDTNRTVAREEVLSSSFSMRRGETVVVGTSRINGGSEALVVLLTAEEG